MLGLENMCELQKTIEDFCKEERLDLRRILTSKGDKLANYKLLELKYAINNRHSIITEVDEEDLPNCYDKKRISRDEEIGICSKECNLICKFKEAIRIKYGNKQYTNIYNKEM